MKTFITILFFVTGLSFCNAQQQNMLFNKVWGPSQSSFTSRIAFADQCSNGDYLLIGSTTDLFSGLYMFYACRTDSTGDILWDLTWGTPDVVSGVTKVIKGFDNSYMVIGPGSEGSGVSHFVVTKIDANGLITYSRYYYFGYDDKPYGITKTRDSCFVICGIKGTGPGSGDPALLKIDREGNEMWRRTFSSLADYHLQNLCETSDSGFVAIGKSIGLNNCFYVKYDKNGMMEWIKYPFGTTTTFINNPGDLRVNTDGSFDIFYKTDLPANPPHTVTGILEHYDPLGDSLLSVQFLDLWVWTVNVSKEDSLFYIVGPDYSYYRLNVSLVFEPLVSPGVSQTWGYIVARDGCYLGFGEYEDNPTNSTRFQITKFGRDNRYQAQSFLTQLKIYPNPTLDGNTTVNFDILTDENVQVQVWSIDGRLIYTDEIFCPANSHTELPIHLDAATANAGTYILEIRTSGEYRRQLLVIGRSDD